MSFNKCNFCLAVLGLGMIVGSSVAIASEPIAIATCEQLEGIGTTIGYLNDDYVQVADLDCSDRKEFWPLGSFSAFTGTYDGGNFVIKNLHIKHGDRVGLFGNLSGATISNVGLIDVNIESSDALFIGGLAGTAINTEINNTYVIGKVTVEDSFSLTGGLISHAEMVRINKSYANVEIFSGDMVGGLVCYFINSTMENSYALGSATGTVAGLVYRNEGRITNSYAAVSVKGEDSVSKGGLVGEGGEDSVIASYWDAELTPEGEIGEPRRTAQMQQGDPSKLTYRNWDTKTIWFMSKGSYPTLR